MGCGGSGVVNWRPLSLPESDSESSLEDVSESSLEDESLDEELVLDSSEELLSLEEELVLLDEVVELLVSDELLSVEESTTNAHLQSSDKCCHSRIDFIKVHAACTPEA